MASQTFGTLAISGEGVGVAELEMGEVGKVENGKWKAKGQKGDVAEHDGSGAFVGAIAVPFAIVYPAVYGPQAALFSELFDTRVRYTGISFVYQFSGIYASGLTPIIATALLPAGGNKPWLICAYILLVSIISAACVFTMVEAHKRDMAVDTK